MKRLGRMLGSVMSVGDVVGLVGPLGCGKTTMAQGIAEGLEVSPARHVASPTFPLVNEHPGRVTFVHADLYRVASEMELRELGLDEVFGRAAAAIEWLDRFPAAAPADRLEVRIEITSDDARLLRVEGTGERGRALARGFVSGAVASSGAARSAPPSRKRRAPSR